MKKRFFSLILVLCMVFALLPMSAFAAKIVDSGECGDNATWTLDIDGTLIISGSGDMWDYEEVDWEDGDENVYPHASDSPFSYSKIENVIINDGITGIGDSTFSVCKKLASITIPDSVTGIGYRAFLDCGNLTKIEIPDSVTSIGAGAFSGCTSLTKIEIPDSVTSIGYTAFNDCDSLTDVSIGKGVSDIGYEAFGNCDNLTNIKVDESNKNYCSVDGMLFTKDATTLVQCPGGKAGKIVIPDSVTCIADDAFGYCDRLTSVTIPGSVTSIGRSAFSGCDNLTSVTIGTGVTSIGAGAFNGCDSLKDVYYRGSEQQWDEINIDYSNGCLLDANIHFNYDPTLAITKQPADLYAKDGTTGYISVTATGEGLTYQWQYQKPDSSTWSNSTASGAKTATLSVSVKDSMDSYKYRCIVKDANGFSVTSKFATLTVTSTSAFEDVSSTAFYSDAVSWAVSKGITNGTSATTFSPDGDCTRAQIVTFLWRAHGCPKPATTKCAFKDVDKKAFYYDAMLWAVNEGITKGIDDTHFAPNDTCTRGQAVTFLWRADGEPAAAISKCPFKDVSKTAFYYKAMMWAVGEEITNGVDTIHFAPNNTCTRGQIVTFLYRDLK